MIANLNHEAQHDESAYQSREQAAKLPKVRHKEVRLIASQIVQAHHAAACSPSADYRVQLLDAVQEAYRVLFACRFRRRSRPLVIVIYTLFDSLADYDSKTIRPELQTCEGVLAHANGFVQDLCRLMAIDRDATIEDMPYTVNKINVEDAVMDGRYGTSAVEVNPIKSIKDAWCCIDCG